MKVIKTIESFAKESRYNRVIEAAVKAGEESKVYIDDIDTDSGKTVKAVEIIGAIAAYPTEKEFKKYFYDQYGENAFGEGEIEVIIKYYNDVKAEQAEAEKEAEKEEGGEGEDGGEDDPLADL
tara:strand:+ start:913 stop:1281 length:369 start_codon:yes stop_codon:yes gene_type:complete